MNIRDTKLIVSLFVNDALPGTKAANHSWLVNQSRPPLSGNLYNPTDSDITITIPAKSRSYLPGIFANAKFAHVEAKLSAKKDKATFVVPLGGTNPAFNSASSKS